jgi:hypothetical protein
MNSLKLKAKDQFDKSFNGSNTFKLKSMIKNKGMTLDILDERDEII